MSDGPLPVIERTLLEFNSHVFQVVTVVLRFEVDGATCETTVFHEDKVGADGAISLDESGDQKWVVESSYPHSTMLVAVGEHRRIVNRLRRKYGAPE